MAQTTKKKKVTDLSPKFREIPPAMLELSFEYTAGNRPMGENSGGVSMFSNSFKRGYGEKVFGSDEHGIWLGAADWENAPFRVDMEGNLWAISANLTGYPSDDEVLKKAGSDQDLTGEINVGAASGIKIDGPNQRIIFYESGVSTIILGEI